jgi:hypothetical protein
MEAGETWVWECRREKEGEGGSRRKPGGEGGRRREKEGGWM